MIPKPKKQKVSITKLKKRLWELCKQITRLRWGNTCYTCRATGLEGGNWQTSHFITDSTCSTELSYDLNNLRPACYVCNIRKSGNWIAYEKRLIEENGEAWVKALKDRNQKTKGLQYDSLWYTKKVLEYENELKRLSNPS